MMRVLIFTPGQESTVGLWQSEGNQWHSESVPRGGQSGNRVLRAVDACLQAGQCTLSDITHIGVMRGPTTYTELRVFVTTANTLAWTLGLPLFAFEPEVIMPDSIPHLLPTAHVNIPVEPVYPQEL